MADFSLFDLQSCLSVSGLFSVIMRDLSNVTHDGPKWIVLDGDIDPMWIESLNTVMDDNKVSVKFSYCKRGNTFSISNR